MEKVFVNEPIFDKILYQGQYEIYDLTQRESLNMREVLQIEMKLEK